MSSTDYYSLEKTAEILGMNPAEVNRLRDRGELRAFRDGVNWKFRKADVDDYLVRKIHARHENADAALLNDEDDDEEMPTLLADSAAFDLMMEDGMTDGELMLDDSLLEDTDASKPLSLNKSEGKPAAQTADNGLSLAADDKLSLDGDDLLLAQDDLSLGDDDLTLAGAGMTATPGRKSLGSADGGSALDLAGDEDEVVLTATGSSTANDLNLASDSSLSLLDSGDLNLTSDSSLSLLEADDDVVLETVDRGGSDAVLELDDDDDILSLVDENSPTVMGAGEGEFELGAAPDFTEDEESESSSQVIALDEGNIFGDIAMDDDATSSSFGEQPAPAQDGMGGFDDSSTFGEMVPGVVPGPAFDPTAGGSGLASGPVVPGGYVKPAEATYGPGMLTLTIGLSAVLFLATLMMFELMQNMWSWRTDQSIVGGVMGTISDMLGLK